MYTMDTHIHIHIYKYLLLYDSSCCLSTNDSPMLKTLFYVHRRLDDIKPLAIYKQFWYASKKHNYAMRS